MELMNPIAIAIIICLIILTIFFTTFSKRIKYTSGKRIANAGIIKETEYYKSKINRYKIMSILVQALSIICIMMVGILIARPVTVQTKSEEKLSRDIILVMDISTSQNEVNLELAKKFKDLVPKIKGDRIGIVIFNTSPVVFCPLTDDYDYINEKLDIIESQMKFIMDNNGVFPTILRADNEEAYAFWNGGAIAGSEERGSSLIGDGLARSGFFFSRVKNK